MPKGNGLRCCCESPIGPTGRGGVDGGALHAEKAAADAHTAWAGAAGEIDACWPAVAARAPSTLTVRRSAATLRGSGSIARESAGAAWNVSDLPARGPRGRRAQNSVRLYAGSSRSFILSCARRVSSAARRCACESLDFWASSDSTAASAPLGASPKMRALASRYACSRSSRGSLGGSHFLGLSSSLACGSCGSSMMSRRWMILTLPGMSTGPGLLTSAASSSSR